VNLTERDQQVLWHPFTQAATELAPIAVTHGEGSWLYGDRPLYRPLSESALEFPSVEAKRGSIRSSSIETQLVGWT